MQTIRELFANRELFAEHWGKISKIFISVFVGKYVLMHVFKLLVLLEMTRKIKDNIQNIGTGIQTKKYKGIPVIKTLVRVTAHLCKRNLNPQR